MLILIGRVVRAPDEVTNFCMVLSSAASIFLMWFFWDSLRPLLARASEWAWIGVLLFFAMMFIVVVCATAFSKENVGTTATLLLILAGTLFLHLKVGWGFWSSLGGAFGVLIVLDCFWLMVKNLIKHLRTRNQSQGESPAKG